MCEFRLSETSASSESIYKLYECVMNKTEIVNKLKFFKQIGEEIQRLRSVRESPEIIALVADWGQGKTTLLSILEEVKHIEKLNFVDILKGNIDFSQNEVVLIDEVETSIELLSEYRDKIKDFWIKIKELANSNKNIVVYLSMTPSAYSKIFGEVLRDLFPETYEAIEQRVKRIHLMPPSKLEFLAVMDCLLEFNKLNKDLLEYMDLPYWTIGQERRRFARFFNDVVCKAGESKSPVDMMFKLLVDNQNLNEEGETIRINEVIKFEKNLDKNEVEEFHKILMSRIFTSKPIEVLKDYVVEGYLVDYYSWAEVVKDGDIIEDFLLVYLNEKDSLDKNLYVFLSDSIDKVIYENVNRGNLEEIVRKLKVRSKKKAYALSWSLFETLVNTNVGGLIVEFESRELKEKAIKFVNEKLLDEEKEVESFISFLRHGMGLEFEEKKINPHTTLLSFKKFNVLVTNKPERALPDLLIHGIIILSDENSLDGYYDELSIKVLHLPLSTPVKRQLLYINFYELLNEKGVRLRKEIVNLKLGDLIDLVNRFISSIDKELTLPSLPLTKGNKRPVQSFNWIIYAPEVYPAKASEVFVKVDDIVNKKFRIFGAKQFHLEDIETAETFISDVVHYFAENDIINVNEEIIDFSNLAGKRVKEFTKVTVGLLRQILKDKLEGEIVKYIQNEEKSDLLNILQKIYGVKRNSVLEFLIYSSIATGEIANYVKIRNLVSLSDIEEKLDKISVSNSYFLTAKKREAGIRDINEMINTIKMYINLAKKSDDKNFLRFLIVIQTLYKQLNRFLEEISVAEENIVKIKVDINKKLELIKRAKSLVNVKEIEEEKLLSSLPDIVTKIREQIVSVVDDENPEELMNFIDAIKKISGNDSNNLNLLVWEAVKIMMDGATLPFTQKLKEIFSPLFPLSGINNYFVKLENEINEIEKASPEIMKLQVQLEEKRKETLKLIQQIKNELGG